MRQTARLITVGTYKNEEVTIKGKKYPASLQSRVQKLVTEEGLDLTKEKKLILVPNTLNPKDKSNYQDTAQKPYLSFTVIGVPVNQSIHDDDLDIVSITGKVFYENLNYKFILVKLEHGRNDQKIKVIGTLNDSIYEEGGIKKGSAKDQYYNIEAKVVDNQLVMFDSWRVIEQVQEKSKPILKVIDGGKQYDTTKLYKKAA